MNEQTWQHANLVSGLGKWAWIWGIVNGIIEIIWAIYLIGAELAAVAYLASLGITVAPNLFNAIWYFIGAAILIFISYSIIKPKFSTKCAERDWEALYGWTLDLGGIKIPWMFIWGIIFTIFSWYYFGGLFVLLPACLLLFAGPRPYNWSE